MTFNLYLAMAVREVDAHKAGHGQKIKVYDNMKGIFLAEVLSMVFKYQETSSAT